MPGEDLVKGLTDELTKLIKAKLALVDKLKKNILSRNGANLDELHRLAVEIYKKKSQYSTLHPQKMKHLVDLRKALVDAENHEDLLLKKIASLENKLNDQYIFNRNSKDITDLDQVYDSYADLAALLGNLRQAIDEESAESSVKPETFAVTEKFKAEQVSDEVEKAVEEDQTPVTSSLPQPPSQENRNIPDSTTNDSRSIVFDPIGLNPSPAPAANLQVDIPGKAEQVIQNIHDITNPDTENVTDDNSDNPNTASSADDPSPWTGSTNGDKKSVETKYDVDEKKFFVYKNEKEDKIEAENRERAAEDLKRLAAREVYERNIAAAREANEAKIREEQTARNMEYDKRAEAAGKPVGRMKVENTGSRSPREVTTANAFQASDSQISLVTYNKLNPPKYEFASDTELQEQKKKFITQFKNLIVAKPYEDRMAAINPFRESTDLKMFVQDNDFMDDLMNDLRNVAREEHVDPVDNEDDENKVQSQNSDEGNAASNPRSLNGEVQQHPIVVADKQNINEDSPVLPADQQDQRNLKEGISKTSIGVSAEAADSSSGAVVKTPSALSSKKITPEKSSAQKKSPNELAANKVLMDAQKVAKEADEMAGYNQKIGLWKDANIACKTAIESALKALDAVKRKKGDAGTKLMKANQDLDSAKNKLTEAQKASAASEDASSSKNEHKKDKKDKPTKAKNKFTEDQKSRGASEDVSLSKNEHKNDKLLPRTTPRPTSKAFAANAQLNTKVLAEYLYEADEKVLSDIRAQAFEQANSGSSVSPSRSENSSADQNQIQSGLNESEVQDVDEKIHVNPVEEDSNRADDDLRENNPQSLQGGSVSTANHFIITSLVGDHEDNLLESTANQVEKNLLNVQQEGPAAPRSLQTKLAAVMPLDAVEEEDSTTVVNINQNSASGVHNLPKQQEENGRKTDYLSENGLVTHKVQVSSSPLLSVPDTIITKPETKGTKITGEQSNHVLADFLYIYAAVPFTEQKEVTKSHIKGYDRSPYKLEGDNLRKLLSKDGLQVQVPGGKPYHFDCNEGIPTTKLPERAHQGDKKELGLTIVNMIDNVVAKSGVVNVNTHDPFVAEMAHQYLSKLKQDGIYVLVDIKLAGNPYNENSSKMNQIEHKIIREIMEIVPKQNKATTDTAITGATKTEHKDPRDEWTKEATSNRKTEFLRDRVKGMLQNINERCGYEPEIESLREDHSHSSSKLF